MPFKWFFLFDPVPVYDPVQDDLRIDENIHLCLCQQRRIHHCPRTDFILYTWMLKCFIFMCIFLHIVCVCKHQNVINTHIELHICKLCLFYLHKVTLGNGHVWCPTEGSQEPVQPEIWALDLSTERIKERMLVLRRENKLAWWRL